MKENFRHESLQDKKSIESLLQAVVDGVVKGAITLEDDDGTITMEPNGLMHVKISGAIEDERNKLNIRIAWRGDRKIRKDKSLKARAGK